MNKYMIMISVSIGDRDNFLVHASSFKEALEKIRIRFPYAQILGQYKIDQEIN